MKIVPIENFTIHCVSGWGWTQKMSEDSDVVSVDRFPETLTFECATAFVLEESIECIQANFLPTESSFGRTLLLKPMTDDRPQLSAQETSISHLVFGDELLVTTPAEIVHRLLKTERLFQLPETRGYSDLASFAIGDAPPISKDEW